VKEVTEIDVCGIGEKALCKEIVTEVTSAYAFINDWSTGCGAKIVSTIVELERL